MVYQNDLIFLREAIKDLQEYILSPELFWRLHVVSSDVRLPQLTIGNLALSQTRLAFTELNAEQEASFSEYSRLIQQVHTNWLSNWRKKAGLEFNSRLKLWQQYVRELRGDSRQHAPFYQNEVRTRTILTLLKEDRADISEKDDELLKMLDQILHGLVNPNEFVWSEDMARGFPQNRFWFLYASIKE